VFKTVKFAHEISAQVMFEGKFDPYRTAGKKKKLAAVLIE
jgi:hypothetical protein